MRAIVVDRWMEPSELTVREAPEPASAPGRARRRRARRRLQLLRHPDGAGQVPGEAGLPVHRRAREVAGVVREVGAGRARASRSAIACFAAGADRRLRRARRASRGVRCTAMPDAMTFDEGAALPDRLSDLVRGARLPRRAAAGRDAARARGRGRRRARRGADRQGARRARASRPPAAPTSSRSRAQRGRRRGDRLQRASDFVERGEGG